MVNVLVEIGHFGLQEQFQACFEFLIYYLIFFFCKYDYYFFYREGELLL